MLRKKRKRKGGHGKRKGSAFERWCCKQLSLWVSNGKRHDIFWRSAMSGGRATVALKTGNLLRRQAGDISAVAPEGHVLTGKFFIECKHVRSLDLEGFFLKGTGRLAKFWKTACTEAEKHGLIPLIIARQNFTPDIVLTDWGVFNTNFVIRVHRPHLASCAVHLLADVLKERL